jgi:acid stress chaperone HdeB
MRFLSILLVAVAMLAAPVHAEMLDLATLKCKEFIGISSSSKDRFELIMTWLEAYYSEENASPVIDFDKIREDGAKFGAYCKSNPDESVIDAADKLLGK